MSNIFSSENKNVLLTKVCSYPICKFSSFCFLVFRNFSLNFYLVLDDLWKLSEHWYKSPERFYSTKNHVDISPSVCLLQFLDDLLIWTTSSCRCLQSFCTVDKRTELWRSSWIFIEDCSSLYFESTTFWRSLLFIFSDEKIEWEHSMWSYKFVEKKILFPLKKKRIYW